MGMVMACPAAAIDDFDLLPIPHVDEVYPLPPPTLEERRLIALVAKVSFNEAHDSYHDLALIWQIVEGHGETARERRVWLRSHSPCVSGRLSDEEALARWERNRSGNCIWTRNLMPTDRLPRGFMAPSGVWHRNLAARWLAHIPRVRDFVRGEDRYRPCDTTPHTWDGVRYGRDRVAPPGSQRRILDCSQPYVLGSDEEGLHNFAVERIINT
jgi:hypothetical protein